MSQTLSAVTGPSGAGKSVFCKRQEDWAHALFNLDDWATKEGNVHDPSVREQAWHKMKLALRRAIEIGSPLIVLDHVCDSETASDIIEPAKNSGYRVLLWIVSPDSPEVCMERIAERKRQGGHGATGRTIKEIYNSALSVASELTVLSDETYFIDSTNETFEAVGSICNYRFLSHVETDTRLGSPLLHY